MHGEMGPRASIQCHLLLDCMLGESPVIFIEPSADTLLLLVVVLLRFASSSSGQIGPSVEGGYGGQLWLSDGRRGGEEIVMNERFSDRVGVILRLWRLRRRRGHTLRDKHSLGWPR